MECRAVIWAAVRPQSGHTNPTGSKSPRQRTFKTDRLCVTVYVGSKQFSGHEMIDGRPNSIKLKSPMTSKVFTSMSPNALNYDIRNAFNNAYVEYILGAETRCKSLSGRVRWFSGDLGRIECLKTGNTYDVHACNIVGAKTWYPETACMFLKEGETVIFDLYELYGQGRYLSASKVRGNISSDAETNRAWIADHFDEKQWMSLNQNSLAFKCDADGNAINGLFASKGE